jgi:hypothetical protein
LRRLLDPDEAAGECPVVFEWRNGAADEEHLEVTAIEAKDHAVDGEGGARILVSVFHTPLLVYH